MTIKEIAALCGVSRGTVDRVLNHRGRVKPETEARVLEALRHASQGRTVLSVSHRVYESSGGRTVEIKPLG